MCVNGPPEMQDLKEEADILMKVIAAYHLSVRILILVSFLQVPGYMLPKVLLTYRSKIR